MKEHFIAWWNVENLFDTSNSTHRPPRLHKRLRNELKGWNASVLKKKVTRLGKIISQLNGGTGPDILGVCEIENRKVLEDLINAIPALPHHYGISHADTKDGRGIDVAFIYDKRKFTANETFSHFILKREATRDIYQLNLKTKSGNELILIGNHWPSRRGGEYKSEPYRILAGETLAYWHERIVEIKGKSAAILVMGDFNDDPYNRSVVDYALSWKSLEKVMRARDPKFYNLMWKKTGDRDGTFYYDGFPFVFDQFWASTGLMTRKGKLRAVEESVKIFISEEMVSKGYPDPIAFKRPSSKDFNPEGYSDHYPLCMTIQEK